MGWVCGHSLALFVQQIEEAGGLLADQVDAADVVRVVNVVPGDPLALVLLLQCLGGVSDKFIIPWPIFTYKHVTQGWARVTYKHVIQK